MIQPAPAINRRFVVCHHFIVLQWLSLFFGGGGVVWHPTWDFKTVQFAFFSANLCFLGVLFCVLYSVLFINLYAFM